MLYLKLDAALDLICWVVILEEILLKWQTEATEGHRGLPSTLRGSQIPGAHGHISEQKLESSHPCWELDFTLVVRTALSASLVHSGVISRCNNFAGEK